MGKFKKDYETNEYVCPACERRYTQYGSLWKHYKLKHGDGVSADSDHDIDETTYYRLTEAVEELLKLLKNMKPKNETDTETDKLRKLRLYGLTSVRPKTETDDERLREKLRKLRAHG